MAGKDKDIQIRSEEVQEVLGEIPYWILRWGITLVGIIVAVLLIGSAIFKYPDIISASVVLTGNTPSAGVVANTPGKVSKLYVRDNQLVNTGEYLAVIENPADTEDVIFLKKFLLSMNQNMDSISQLPPKDLTLGHMQSSFSSFYTHLFNYMEFVRLNYHSQKISILNRRLKDYEGQYTNTLRQQSVIEKQLEIARNQYKRDSLLRQKEILAEEALEGSHKEYLQYTLTLENTLSSLKNLEIQINQLMESLTDIQHQYIENKNSLEIQVRTSLSQLLSEIQIWELTYVLIAPIDGKITFTEYWAENQNVNTGNVIFTIVPTEDEEFFGNALLPVTRSGKVEVGQGVNIRFENFPDNEFGVVKGIVDNISLVPSGSNYIVRIKLPEGLKTTYKKELPFLPEMQGQADIITENISLLERFFMPIKKIWTEGMEE